MHQRPAECQSAHVALLTATGNTAAEAAEQSKHREGRMVNMPCQRRPPGTEEWVVAGRERWVANSVVIVRIRMHWWSVRESARESGVWARPAPQRRECAGCRARLRATRRWGSPGPCRSPRRAPARRPARHLQPRCCTHHQPGNAGTPAVWHTSSVTCPTVPSAPTTWCTSVAKTSQPRQLAAVRGQDGSFLYPEEFSSHTSHNGSEDQP